MPTKDHIEEQRWLSEPLTPNSEKSRAAWGSLLMSLQASKGLCKQSKCVRRDGHAGDCWPH